MTVQNRNHNPPLIGPRWQEFSLAPAPPAGDASFHASLRECAVDHAQRPEPKPQESAPALPRASEPQQTPPNPRGRAWPSPLAENTLPSNTQLQVVKPATPERSVPSRSPVSQTQRAGSRVLAHVRSWLQAKYSRASTKRLKVMEMIPLGEKRFLAVVSVEGHEFLIGGGASGVSVVTQLEGALGTEAASCAEFALQGKSA